MLYPLHLLVSDAEGGWRVEALAHRSWRPTVLVPRALCLFESLACTEVRLYELRGFARLQAERLSPFGRTGASAARRGERLLLWVWDAEEVEHAAQQAGLGAQRPLFVAEPLYLRPPAGHGSQIERAAQSMVRVVYEGGGVLRSEVLAPAPVDIGVIRSRPWAYNWLARWGVNSGGEAESFDWRTLLNGVAAAVAAAMFCFAAYQAGGVLGSQRAVERLASQLDASVATRREASAISRDIETDVRWLRLYGEAVRQLDFTAFVKALRPVLERHGVVLSELEANETELRIVVVTVGGEIRLPDLLVDLDGVAGGGARLVQQDELKRATFVLKANSFVVEAAADVERGARAER